MRQFTLTDEQYRKAEAWMDERRRYAGAIGGQFSFVFTPTSIGMAVSVQDEKESFDLTDCSDW